MKKGRRDFLKNIAIISAGSLILPKNLRANPLSSITVEAPELEGATYNDSWVYVYDAGTGVELGRGQTFNSVATVSLTPTSIKNPSDTSGLLAKINAQDLGGQILINYPVHNESKVQIGLYDIKGSSVFEDSKFQGRGNQSYVINTNKFGRANGVYLFRVITNDYSQTIELPILRGGNLGATHTGNPINMQSRKQIDRLDKIGSNNYRIVVSNPNAKHYTLTAITEPATDFKSKVVGYVQQAGVTAALFKAFCKENNFDAMPALSNQGHNVEGLKEFLQTPNTLLWITYRDPAGMALQSAANEAYVENLLSTRFLPSISSTHQPSVHVVNPQHPEDPPMDPNGKLIIQPTEDIYSNMGVASFGKNGVINTGVIQFAGGRGSTPSTWPNPTYDQEKIRFFTQAVCAPQGTTNPQYNNLTILSTTAPTADHSAMDKKLIKITEYYKPKSSIDDILKI